MFLCLLLGLLYAAVLYYREDKFNESGTWLKYVLAFLRTIGVAGLASLLLSPLLRQITEEIKKPQVVILQDKSLSIGAEQSQQFLTSLSDEKSALEEDFELSYLDFAETVNTQSDSIENNQTTNISAALQYVYDVYNGQNLGAVIIASDGLYNEGRNPLYYNKQFKAPIHTIGFGDTTIRKDLIVKNVLYNRIAYLGDKFNVQVDVQAFNAAGNSSRLSISKEQGDTFVPIKNETIRINKNQFFDTKTITLDASSPGITRYRVALNKIAGEQTTKNNYQDIYVEVLDSRLKILVMANAPHPDIATLNDILELNKNYEITVQYAGDKKSTAGYDFYVFHNLPSRAHGIQNVLSQINKSKSPRLFFVGAQTYLNAYNKAQNTLSIRGNNATQNDVQAILANSFTAFNLSDNTKSKVNQFVPVIAPFGEYKAGPKTTTLLFQKIGSVETKYPLLSFSDDNGIKTSVMAAEGIWKWKLFDYLQHNNFDVITDLIDKTFVYTSVKEDKRKFRATVAKNIFKENDNIFFDAELYNNAYQLVNDPDAFLTIKNSSGEAFDYTFSQTGNAYNLDAGRFPAGTYSYTASTNVNGQALNQSGRFTVESIQLELFNTTADHGLLRNLSRDNGGKFYYPNEFTNMVQDLKTDSSIKPVVYATTNTKPIIHFKWLFALLFLFIILEWFLRRFYGHY